MAAGLRRSSALICKNARHPHPFEELSHVPAARREYKMACLLRVILKVIPSSTLWVLSDGSFLGTATRSPAFLYWDAIKLTNTLEMFIHIEVYNVLSTRRIRSPLPYMSGWLPHHASLKVELVPHCPERTSRKLFISLSVL
ncbi:hypothetical protein CISG_08363 [Coccidioides immitis RMSCC 3703]|uniref:Uncharacterized protein n=1 Tax=Coccidioides immitis RMSCC 3703 TaxID=454286 RepID=A0A0J8U1G3_COCIT|nr:hypothetical protein CISG_08363 [Coccidioides immitis RMSCC 3703]